MKTKKKYRLSPKTKKRQKLNRNSRWQNISTSTLAKRIAIGGVLPTLSIGIGVGLLAKSGKKSKLAVAGYNKARIAMKGLAATSLIPAAILPGYAIMKQTTPTEYVKIGSGRQSVYGQKGLTMLTGGKSRDVSMKSLKIGLSNANKVWSDHPRVVIPKSRIDLEGIGFKRTHKGMMEPGQSLGTPQFRDKGTLHAHDWDKYYVIHRDKHSPQILGVKGAVKMMRHGISEGIPAIYNRMFNIDPMLLLTKKDRKKYRKQIVR